MEDGQEEVKDEIGNINEFRQKRKILFIFFTRKKRVNFWGKLKGTK